jgi:hypothetical protein
LSIVLSLPDRTARVRRSTARLCALLGWSVIHEMPLPNGRRADLLALRPDGHFVCIEVKSGARDFLSDEKWHEYRGFCDALFFAVDPDFPLALLPAATGLIVADESAAELMHDAPEHPLSASRRRALMLRFATLAADRLAALQDPDGPAARRHWRAAD